MNDFSTDIAPAPAETPSTVLDTETDTRPSGGGTPRTLADDKAPSLRDTISAVVKEEGEERQKAEEKPADDAKPDAKTDTAAKAEPKDAKPAEKAEEKAVERGADGKFASKAKDEAPADDAAKPANDAEAAPKPDEKPSDAKHYTEPPKNFLPDAKDMWRNVPRPVRRDIEIMVREHEEAVSRSRQDNERYEAIRPFDELARQNGRDLRESLARINQVENLLRQNPIAGLDAILREIGPRKQDGGALSLYDVAAHIVSNGPDAFQQTLQQVQRNQPPQPDPQFVQAQQELAETRARLVQVEVIAPFKAEHPRYDELQDAIATILKSGMIPTSLSAAERLEAAYVYADRLNPASTPPAETQPAPAPESRAADSLNGQKSIRSAPGAVSDDMEPERGGSIRELLQDEMRRLKRS